MYFEKEHLMLLCFIFEKKLEKVCSFLNHKLRSIVKCAETSDSQPSS